MAKYQYKAIKDGTLSSPFRHVRKGETVTSDEPINASWLVDAKKVVPESPRPVFGGMESAQAKAGIIPTRPRNTGRHPISDPSYDRSIADLNKVNEKKPDDKGTGAQDVN